MFDPYILPSNSLQNIRQNHDNEILVNESHIFYEASLNVMCAWIQYAKLSWMFAHKKPYDIGQYHWTMKCRSRNLHLHILRLFLCHTESKALKNIIHPSYFRSFQTIKRFHWQPTDTNDTNGKLATRISDKIPNAPTKYQ